MGRRLHKPHLPHIVPQKYFDMCELSCSVKPCQRVLTAGSVLPDPDVSAISLPANMNVPKNFPAEAWSPSNEIRSYDDAGPEFAESNFSMTNPPAVSEIRLRRRGYFGVTHGRVAF